MNKCGNWYCAATPLAVTTSISGQEGTNPYMRRVIVKGQPTSNFIAKMITETLPFFNKRNLFGAGKTDSKVTRKMKDDAAHIEDQRKKKLAWTSADGRIEMWWIHCKDAKCKEPLRSADLYNAVQNIKRHEL